MVQEPEKLLVVEGVRPERQNVCRVLQSRDHPVVSACGLESTKNELESHRFGAVLADWDLGAHSGPEVCHAVSRLQPGVPVVLLSDRGSMSRAVHALRAGAYDFVAKPIEEQHLTATVNRALDYHRTRAHLRLLDQARRGSGTRETLTGECEPMRRVYDLVDRVADTPSSVLITGESGTGKELVARALHKGSGRSGGPFITINCSSVPEHLLESELFGHEKGAFTDAKKSHEGLFVQANGGTLFLDEVGEMPLEMQPKLLRFLQEQIVRPVGCSKETRTDVRVVAATNRDLDQDIATGKFREDLYYRLNVIQIHVPPLRNRGSDVLLLANSFVEESAAKLGRPVKGITAEAAEDLLAYDWPGNVRQLQNSIERAVALTRFDKITPQDLPERVVRRHSEKGPRLRMLDRRDIQPLEVIERQYIKQVLEVTGNNKSQAARLLHMDRRTLYRKLGDEESDSLALRA